MSRRSYGTSWTLGPTATAAQLFCCTTRFRFRCVWMLDVYITSEEADGGGGGGGGHVLLAQ